MQSQKKGIQIVNKGAQKKVRRKRKLAESGTHFRAQS
jgi:hypothetical protein